MAAILGCSSSYTSLKCHFSLLLSRRDDQCRWRWVGHSHQRNMIIIMMMKMDHIVVSMSNSFNNRISTGRLNYPVHLQFRFCFLALFCHPISSCDIVWYICNLQSLFSSHIFRMYKYTEGGVDPDKYVKRKLPYVFVSPGFLYVKLNYVIANYKTFSSVKL